MRGLASLANREQRNSLDNWAIPWGTNLSSGTGISQDTAYTLSAVWACQTLISDAIATLPVDTYRKKGAVREPTTPPAWLATPNPMNSRIDYETQRLLSLLGWGNAYSLLVRQYGSSDPMDPVVERWLLDPSRVSVRRVNPTDETSRLIYLVHGQAVEVENIQHIRGYMRPGLFFGMSVIREAARSMGMSVDAEQTAQNLFANGIQASGVLEVPQLPAEASHDVVEKIRESFMSRYSGSGNAHKPIVLTGGTKWNQTMISPVDAELLDSRKFQINEICRWFRVPPHKIQDIVAHASQGGGQGLEQQAGEFAQDTLLPWIVRLEEADSALLVRGQFVKFNLNAYVRADILTRHQVYQIRRYIGMNNADDLRALEDEPPIPNGDGKAYWRPANMVNVDAPAPQLTPTPGDPVVPATAPTPDQGATSD